MMRGCGVAVTRAPCGAPCTLVATRSYVQRPDLTTLAQGAGLQSMEPGFNNPFSRYKPSAPAADLSVTSAGRGLGTSESDPYFHTLPNLPLKDVVSSVLGGESHGASRTLHLSKDDVARLPESSRKLAAWLEETLYSEGHATEASPTRVTHTTVLALFINAHMKIELPLPKHADAEKRLKAFGTNGIREVCIQMGNPSVDVACASWKQATDRFAKLPLNLFDPNGFLADVNRCREACLSVAREIIGGSPSGLDAVDDDTMEPFTDAIDVITRAVLERRNSLIDDHVLVPCCGGSDAVSRAALRTALDGGHGVWKSLLAHIEANSERLIGGDDVLRTKFEWMKNHGRTAPSVSPSLAIYLILSALSLSSTLTQQAVPPALSGNRSHTLTLESMNPLYGVTVDARLNFVKDTITELSQDMETAKALRLALEKAGRREVATAIGMVAVADHMKSNIIRREVAHIAALLKDEDAARAFCVQVAEHAKTTVDTASAVAKAFGLANIDHLKVLPDKGWANYHTEFCEILFRDEGESMLLKTASDALGVFLRTTASQEAKASSPSEGMPTAYQLPNRASILNTTVKAALDGILVQRSARKGEQSRTESNINVHLMSPHVLDETLEILESCGVDVIGRLSALDNADGDNSSKLAVDADVLRQSLQLVCRENLQWVSQGIVADEDPTLEDPSGAHITMTNVLNILLRLTYVPQAAHAMLKRNLRGRLGEVSVEAKDQNLPVEIGQSEVYDVQKYKRYDPQGWYQRMQDIHHRNVSTKMRLSDLRVLNHAGTAPYGDMQTERRLRVVAGDKVGMGNVLLDSDRFEDRADNQSYGGMKLQEVLAEARKATLGPEYWPTVEVKVRNPSGQTRAMQSLIDYSRIEKTSADLFKQYCELKAKTMFVSPTQLYIHGGNNSEEVNVADEGDAHEARKRDAQRGFLDNEFTS